MVTLPKPTRSKMRSSILFAILLVLVSCKKEASPPLQPSNNPTSYLLKKMTFDHTSATNGESFYFSYNSNNLVIEVKRVEWGGGMINGTPQWYFTTTYSFAYNGTLPMLCTIKENGDIRTYLEYFYQADRIYKRICKYPDGSIQYYTFYSYDGSGRVKEAIDSSDKVNFKHVLEYNTNLTTSTTYVLWSNPQTKSKTEYSSFDDKVNFIKAVNGLPPTADWDNFNLHSYSSPSPNNMGREQHFWDVDINKDYEVPSTMEYSYQYNDEGLPIKMQYGGWTVTFEYQKYK